MMLKRFLTVFLLSNLLIQIITANDNTINELEKSLNSASDKQRAEVLLKLAPLYFEQTPQKGFVALYEAKHFSETTGTSQLQTEVLNTIGAFHQRTGSYDSALIYYNKAVGQKAENKTTIRILDNIGVLYKELSNFEQAIKYHQQAYSMKELLGDRKGCAMSLNYLGNVFLEKGDFEKSVEYYNKSLKIRQQINDTNDISASLVNLGNVHKRMLHYNEALNYLMQALELRQQGTDRKLQAVSLNAIGNFYLQIKIYDKAREYYSRSLEMREQLGDKNDIAESYNNIGTVHRDLGNFAEALRYYQKSLDLRKEAGNKDALAYAMNNIGGVYWKQKDYKKAIEYYKLALDIRQQIGNKSNIAASLKNIGINYKDMQQWQEALMYYQSALDIYEKISDYSGFAAVNNLKGNLYKSSKDLANAKLYYGNALEIYQKLGDKRNTAFVKNNIGEVLADMGQMPKAITELQQTLAIANEIHDKEIAKNACLSLSTVYEKMHNSALALDFYKQHIAIRDSLIHDENKKRIAEIEFETTIKLKDNEIKSQASTITEKELKISQQRILILVGIAVLLIIGIFSIMLYKQFKQKQKAYVLLDNKSKQLEAANEELEFKNIELADKNIKITDSIAYAKRIQQAILPSREVIKKNFPQSFIFYRPKEVVSGDFYWCAEHGSKLFLATVDCTGHGVPGAFMSMIGNTLLNEIVNESGIEQPAEVLTRLDKAVIKALKQHSDSDQRQEDGMELTFLCIDRDAKTVTYASANHKFFVVSDNKIEGYSGDIFAIGGMYIIKQRKNAKFTQHTIPLQAGSVFYLFSDGFIDQFGGTDGKERFKTSRFQQLLYANHQLDMEEQCTELSKQFDLWKGEGRQIDDVMVLGIKL